MLSDSYWVAAAGDFSEAKGFIRSSTGEVNIQSQKFDDAEVIE